MPPRIWGSPADRAVVCPECGALVLKVKKHRKWHRALG